MSAIAKFRLTVIGGMSIDGQDSVGAFISCEPAALRGIAALFDEEVSIVAADRITALEAQIAAADRLAKAADDLRDAHWNNPHGIRGRHINGVIVALDAYRAAKGE